MKRREVIALLGGTAATWPLAAPAQQGTKPVIGFLSAGAREPLRQQIAAFLEGLKETGYVEGQNVAVEYRFTEGQFDRFPALASDLVRRQVAVLFVASNAGARAAKQATSTIPIVFSVGEDPVASGLVPSLNRPGGNLTGVYQFSDGLEAKRLGLLHEMVPKATIIAVFINPNIRVPKTSCARCRKRRPAWGCNSLSCTPMWKAISMPRFRPLSNSGPRRFWFAPLRSSMPGASSSSCWPHAMHCLRSMNGANSPRPEA
jgi:ABC-type uncharacterized transport system substrate-binding protein